MVMPRRKLGDPRVIGACGGAIKRTQRAQLVVFSVGYVRGLVDDGGLSEGVAGVDAVETRRAHCVPVSRAVIIGVCGLCEFRELQVLEQRLPDGEGGVVELVAA